jgi:beta-mannosidase
MNMPALTRPLLLLLSACGPLAAAATSATATLSLGGSTKAVGGSPWTLRNANASISVPATVPGVVHLDLLRAGKIAEPYYRYGELDLAWIYLENWTYSRTIAAGALGAEPGRVLLRSEGLDTLATVTLNGKRIAETFNMFHRPVWDVSSVFLPAASNTLEIAFASPALGSSANHDAYPYPVAGSYITPLQYPSCGCPDPAACFAEAKGCECLIKCKHSGNDETTRNFLRKSQAHWVSA